MERAAVGRGAGDNDEMGRPCPRVRERERGTHLGSERNSTLSPFFSVITMSPHAPTPRPMVTTLTICE